MTRPDPGPGGLARSTPGVETRQLAVEALLRIDQGAYANLVLPTLLDRSRLERRDRALVTDLVYGTTRMRRACDFLVDRFLVKDPPAALRAVLRLGAYQLAFLQVPPHAAVATTVATAPARFRGVANAVLRRVADSLPVAWPSPAIALSYPDWIVERLVADLGEASALAALAHQNEPAAVTERQDGYIQDRASQWAVEAVGAQDGELVLDICAAPGGKATALAAAGARVVAADHRPNRVSLVTTNASRLGLRLAVLVADGRAAPFPAGSFDRVLVDAPCSGLGVLRRRPDARWRIQEADVERLALLQTKLLGEAARLVRPGGRLVYAVCTLTTAETTAVAATVADSFVPFDVAADRPEWTRLGAGALVLPQAHDTDGMAVFAWTNER